MNIDCQTAGMVLSGIAALVAIGAVVVAIITLKRVCLQTELLRRQVFGEVYDQAQIRNLRFYLPERQKHAVEGFQQSEDSETLLGESVTIPCDCERELHIRWQFAESQTLRAVSIGFPDEHDGKYFGFKSKPTLIKAGLPFRAREYQSLQREAYIDWHGFYRCEYGYSRRLAKDQWFVNAIEVKGQKEGDYILEVEIFVAEAPHPFRGYLKVKCQ